MNHLYSFVTEKMFILSEKTLSYEAFNAIRSTSSPPFLPLNIELYISQEKKLSCK